MKKAMKKIQILVIAISALLLGTSAYAVDESFNVSITILTAITITESGTGLDFGNLPTSTSAQTVTVSPGDSGAATFDIAGEPNGTVTVSVAESSVNLAGPGTNIVVDTFTVDGTNCSGGAGTLDGSGNLTTCSVGATANVNANQTTGSYSGTATLQVIYN